MPKNITGRRDLHPRTLYFFAAYTQKNIIYIYIYSIHITTVIGDQHTLVSLVTFFYDALIMTNLFTENNFIVQNTEIRFFFVRLLMKTIVITKI